MKLYFGGTFGARTPWGTRAARLGRRFFRGRSRFAATSFRVSGRCPADQNKR